MVRKSIFAVLSIGLIVSFLISCGPRKQFEPTRRSIVISPASPPALSLSAKPGDTVIWVNRSKSVVDVNLGKQDLSVTCGGPHSFQVRSVNGQRIARLAAGQVASHCFVDAAEYPFDVTFVSPEEPIIDGHKSIKGVVSVERVPSDPSKMDFH